MSLAHNLLVDVRRRGADVALDDAGRSVLRCACPLPDDLLARLRTARDELGRWLRLEHELGPEVVELLADIAEDRDALAAGGVLPETLLSAVAVLVQVERRLHLFGPAEAAAFVQALYCAEVALDVDELVRLEADH